MWLRCGNDIRSIIEAVRRQLLGSVSLLDGKLLEGRGKYFLSFIT